MSETLMHYAAKPIGLVREWPYEQKTLRSFGKPEGFWVSVAGEDDWLSWCESERCFSDSLNAAHRVTLAASANILRLTDVQQMQDFHNQWTVETDFQRKYPQKGRVAWPINWPAITELYDGIIIAPYHWSCRYSMDWYYGWDCASGCIWNLNAIASVELAHDEAVSA